jgi:hypothetical protein
MSRLTQHLSAIVLVALVLGCASNPPSDSAPRGDRSILTAQQLDEHNFQNAYEAVQALRSNWLQPRGPDSFQAPSQVWVYLDNIRLGDVETLRSIHPRTILEIRHFDPNAATARWGVGHSAGVIYITSFPGVKPMPSSPPEVIQAGSGDLP